ncbi:hypothetical protein CA284_16460 [Enterobacter mori]|nr:hypothetical protein CA284_16460 [Enterobacter mori]
MVLVQGLKLVRFGIHFSRYHFRSHMIYIHFIWLNHSLILFMLLMVILSTWMIFMTYIGLEISMFGLRPQILQMDVVKLYVRMMVIVSPFPMGVWVREFQHTKIF